MQGPLTCPCVLIFWTSHWQEQAPWLAQTKQSLAQNPDGTALRA